MRGRHGSIAGVISCFRAKKFCTALPIWLTIFLALPFSITTAGTPQPLDAKFCDVAAHPKPYFGAVVRFRAHFYGGFEYQNFNDESCPLNRIFLSFDHIPGANEQALTLLSKDGEDADRRDMDYCTYPNRRGAYLVVSATITGSLKRGHYPAGPEIAFLNAENVRLGPEAPPPTACPPEPRRRK